MSARTLFFVRHGQTEWNAEQRMQGQANSPLTPTGRKHARQSGQFLAQFPIDFMYVSPLGRVQQTLSCVQEYVDAPWENDERLREWHCGEWSGHLYKDLRHKWPEDWAKWQKDRYRMRPPGGENYPDMFARVAPFIEGLGATKGEHIAILSHGMIGRIMISSLMGLQPGQTMRMRQANNVVIRLQIDAGKVEADHFVAGKGPRPGLPLAKHA